MKNCLIMMEIIVLLITAGYFSIKQITCPIPQFNNQELEFIQNEEVLK